MAISRFCALAGLCCLASFASSQENIFRPLPGAKQFGISGNWTNTGGASSYRVMLEGGLYITESLIAIARLGLEKHSPEQRQYLMGARYQFKSRGASIPYLIAGVEFHDGQQGQVQLLVVDPSHPKGTFLQAGAGVDHFLNARTALFFEVVGFKAPGSNAIGTDFQVGLRIFFK